MVSFQRHSAKLAALTAVVRCLASCAVLNYACFLADNFSCECLLQGLSLLILPQWPFLNMHLANVVRLSADPTFVGHKFQPNHLFPYVRWEKQFLGKSSLLSDSFLSVGYRSIRQLGNPITEGT